MGLENNKNRFFFINGLAFVENLIEIIENNKNRFFFINGQVIVENLIEIIENIKIASFS